MKRHRIIAVSTGLVLVLAGCSDGSSGGANPAAIIMLAADKTEEAGTARIWMDMQTDGPDGVVTTIADGVLDMTSNRGKISMEMEMPDAPAGTPTDTSIDAVMDGTVMYMKMPGLSQELPGGKPWLRFDLQVAGEELGIDLGALMQAGGSDPTRTLQYLRGASGEVETVGEEEVRDVDATHYRANLSFEKIVEQAPEDLRAEIEPTVDLLKEWVGSDAMPVDVWLDREGRMVRQKQSFEYVSGPAAGSSVSMTMEMYDFGADVDVALPPRSQVTDLSRLLEGAGQPTSAP